MGRYISPPEKVRGYYIDFSGKATEASWPPPWLKQREMQLHVSTAQWGLGAYERYLSSGEERWLAAAGQAGRHLIDLQHAGDGVDGGWLHLHPMPHTYRLDPPWLSAMAQGEGASLLVRLHLETGEQELAEAARRALRPMRIPTAAGGVLTDLEGTEFVEEYPTRPPSYVLNGAIFAVWGFRDVGIGLGDADASSDFERLLEGLAARIHRFDTGYWSRYDLYPHPVPNVASGAYHLLHINQLRASQAVAPRPALATTLQRFESYLDSRPARARALAQKVLFRVLVPRNRLLARLRQRKG